MDDDIPELVTELDENFTIKPEHSARIEDTKSFEPKTSKVTSKIPISIITGYLGSGKSTLLEMIGRKSKKRLAIILNEFGDSAAIEKSVTIQDAEKNESVQEWLDLGNGCLCCTVKDNGVTAIEILIENSGDKIDYILLETTGIADPAPIAEMFWLDDALASTVYIDGVITVVDAANIIQCLDDVGGHWHRANNHVLDESEDVSPEKKELERRMLEEGISTAHVQLALADTILINKIDTIRDDEKKLEEIRSRVKSINSSSPIHTTSYGDIDLDKILDLHAFEASSEKLSQLVSLSTSSSYHDDRIKTLTLDFPFFEDGAGFKKVEKFLQHVLWEDEADGVTVEIHRTKGILVHGDDVRVIQGVRDTYEIIEGGNLHESIKNNKIVFIGKGLDEDALYSELTKFLE